MIFILMETKEQLIINVREWVKIDGEIKRLQKEIKIRRERKKQITGSLVDVMKNNQIDCLDLNDGQLMYSKNKIKAPITKKSLYDILGKYFNDDKEKTELMAQYILDNRNVIEKENIRRKIDKN
jgi:hypothetical protein